MVIFEYAKQKQTNGRGLCDYYLLQLNNNTKPNKNQANKANVNGGVYLGKLYTCDEVADHYCVKVITVWDWIRKGRLKAIKMPKGYRIAEEALTEYEQRKEDE